MSWAKRLKSIRITRSIVPLVAAVFSGFIMLVIFIAYNYGRYLNELELVIVQEELESQKMRLNSELMELARSRTRLTSQIIDLDDVFEQDEINLQLDIHASRFAKLRAELMQLNLNEEEKLLLDEQSKIVPVILPAQRQAVELAMNEEPGDDKKAEKILYEIVLPGQGKMIDSFGKLIAIEQERIAEFYWRVHWAPLLCYRLL